MKYIGIDGCRGGWFLTGLNDDGSSTYCLLQTIVELDAYLDAAEMILIDVPIGLRDRHPDERLCDKQARRMLDPKRGPSVFPAPSRCALSCTTYEDASKRNKECTGRGLSKQSFGILPKIREVDNYLKNGDRRTKIHEMHPEVCFWALNNRAAMTHKKSKKEGYEERVAVLMRKYAQANKIIIGGQTFTDEVKVSAIPVKLGVYYSLPLSSHARFFLNGGVGYYFAKWSEAYRNEWSGNWWTTDQKARASGIGFHGGVGFELNLASNIAFVLEGQGRYAKIGGFKGDEENKIYSPPTESSEKGKIYYFEWFPWTENWYPMIDLSEEEPSGDRIRNVREAKVDFSGFTFRAGIKINF